MVLNYPRHLQIFLSNRCNLACSYCYVAVNKGESKKLEFSQIAKASDLLLSSPSQKKKLISFLGGEPLLQLPLVLQTADYVRRHAAEPVAINLYTNGVGLDRKTLKQLAERDIFTIISLDGERSVNDLGRVFANGRGSVFDAVTAKIAKLPDKKNLGINMVVTANGIENLTQNVDFFYRMGFRSINFYPEAYSTLSREELTALRKSLKKFADYYVFLFEAEPWPFSIPAFSSFLERRAGSESSDWWHSCGNIVLGFDGNFHACDKAMSFPPEHPKDSAVGSPERGMDWVKREAFYAQARRAISRSPRRNFTFCPMGVYFYSRWSNRERKPLEDNFREIDSMFSSMFEDILTRIRAFKNFRAMYSIPVPKTPEPLRI